MDNRQYSNTIEPVDEREEKKKELVACGRFDEMEVLLKKYELDFYDDEIQDYIDEFRNLDLPKTRDEFEYRATLFQLLRDLQRFIDLKVCYFRDHQ